MYGANLILFMIVKSLLKLRTFEESLKQINERMREVQEFREIISVQGEFSFQLLC